MGLFPFVTEQLMTKEQAIEITSPFRPELAAVWPAAWGEWQKMSEEQRGMLAQTPFVPPITVFGFAQYFAKQAFLNREHEGIVFCPELRGVFGFYIHNKALLRFNTVDSDFVVRVSQNGSDHRDQYFRQEPIAGLNNDATRLTVGYVANPTKSGISSVVISCQVGDDLYYSFPIDGGDDSVLPVPAPTEPPEPSSISEQIIKAHPH